MEAALTKFRSIFERLNGFRGFRSWWVMSNFHKGGEFDVAIGLRFRENVSMEVYAPTTTEKDREVFDDWFCIRTGGEFCCMGTVGDEALVGSYPGVEVTEGLLEVGFQIIKENVTVFTENQILELVECTDRPLSLLFASLSLCFGSAAVAVRISC